MQNNNRGMIGKSIFYTLPSSAWDNARNFGFISSSINYETIISICYPKYTRILPNYYKLPVVVLKIEVIVRYSIVNPH